MPMAGMPTAQDNSARHLMQMQMQGMNLQQMQGMGITGASRFTLRGVLIFPSVQRPILPGTLCVKHWRTLLMHLCASSCSDSN